MTPRQPRQIPAAPAPRKTETARLRVLPGTARTAWSAIMAGTLAPGDRVLLLDTGPLAALWAGIASGQGLSVELFEDPTEAALSRHLGADRFGGIKAVLLVASEGAIDTAAARRALDGCFHDALLLVDASAAPCPDAALRDADTALTDPEAGLARLAGRPACAAE